VPVYEQRDARGLVGHAQPVPFFGAPDELTAEVGVAVVLGDELWQASAREADRAILGACLIIDWGRHGRAWSEPPPCPTSPAQVGPTLVMRHRLRDLARLEVQLTVGDRKRSAGCVGDWVRTPGETLAWMSHHLPLRAGDLVGLGCLPDGRIGPGELNFGDRLSVTLPPLQRLEGWATKSGVAPLSPLSEAL
jgi:2-keto-4-pentenoate hydratase/2-oxohepta-3-ene-1,7-dioic acid hydratase in catechol pathway